MAVTCTVVRNHDQLAGRGGTTEFCTASLAGTYATGGFTFNASGVRGNAGTSPQTGSTVLAVQWLSPSGYTYASTSTKAGFVTTVTTKIFSAPGVELAAGAAVPDATIPVILTKNRA